MGKKAKMLGNFVNNLYPFIEFMICVFIGANKYIENDSFLIFSIYGIVIPLLICNLSIFFISTPIHELGHLIFGLKNKLKFKEYNFLFFSVCKEDGKLKIKFRSISNGIGGYCLFDFSENASLEKFISFCYGGVVMNLVMVFLFLPLVFLVKNTYLLIFSISMVITNLGMFITNLIPFEIKNIIDTDGMKIKKAKEDKNYFDKIHKMEIINKHLKSGKKISELPDDLITLPQNLKYDSDYIEMSLYILKLVEEKKYEEAIKLSDEILLDKHLNQTSKFQIKISLIEVYLNLKDTDKLKSIYDKDLFTFIKFLSPVEKTAYPLVYLYYLLTDEKKLVDKTKNNVDKYALILKNGKVEQQYIDYCELVELIESQFGKR